MDDRVSKVKRLGSETSRELEVSVLKFLAPYRDRRLLVAVSGGRDSVLLFHILQKLTPRLNIQLNVAHVFHGHSAYRRKAFEFVKEMAGGSFVANVKNPSALSDCDDLGNSYPREDEQSLRNFRKLALLELKRQTKSDFVALGHHRNDLFETRLIRMIRGTGLGGIKSMGRASQSVLRPFLPFWREQLETVGAQLRFLEDPSNEDTHFLRNWVRHHWLRELEAYRPGSQKTFARSLENLSVLSKKTLSDFSRFLNQEGLDRLTILSLSNVEQRQIIASYLREKNVKNYSASHVDEVLKRLKSSQKTFEFKVAGRVWNVSSHRVRLSDG